MSQLPATSSKEPAAFRELIRFVPTCGHMIASRRRKEARMTEHRLHDDPMSRVRQEMEVITADGRCAGHVSACTADQIFVGRSDQPIPKEWIRRVDREVYISKRWHDLTY
jgi:hypothetical protein